VVLTWFAAGNGEVQRPLVCSGNNLGGGIALAYDISNC
jgi:hypothetical protein